MTEFIQSLTVAAGEHDHHLLLAVDGPGDLDRLLNSGAVDAVLLAGIARHDERVARLAQRGVPFACFGRTNPSRPQSWIDVDSRGGVRRVTERLINGGHSRLAFLGYGPGPLGPRPPGRLQRRDDRSGPAGAGHDPDAREPRVHQAIEALLDTPTRPTAIVTGSDVLAAAVYTVATQRGLHIGIGEDLSVTGFDGSMVGRLLTPTLTTLAIPTTAIAERLVARALAEIGGPTGAPGELVDAELVEGLSG
jgi:DNA-binding LacI/PurR family transcriptional regulator